MLTNNVFLSQAAPWPLLQTFIFADSHLSSFQILNSVKQKIHFGALLDKQNTEANAYPYVHLTSKPLPLPS